jgi:hypothetical protein
MKDRIPEISGLRNRKAGSGMEKNITGRVSLQENGLHEFTPLEKAADSLLTVNIIHSSTDCGTKP